MELRLLLFTLALSYTSSVDALSGFWSFGQAGQCIPLPTSEETVPFSGRFGLHNGYYQAKYQFDLDVEATAICSVDETLSTVIEPGIYNESVHKDECDSYTSTLDYLDETPRKFAFHSNQFNAIGFVPILKIYRNVPETGSRLQFLMSAKLHATDLFIVKAVFGSSELQEEFVLGTLENSDLPDGSMSCFGLNGTFYQYSLDAEVVSDAINAQALDARNFRSLDIGLEISDSIEVERKVLIDTLRMVRDVNVSAGETLESSRFQSQLVEVSIPEGADFRDPLTVLFVFVPVLVLVFGIYLVTSKERRESEVLVNRFAVVWLVTSLASLGYASYQLAEFVEVYAKFVADVQVYSDGLFAALENVSPQELDDTLPGQTPRGFSALFMPPLSQATIEMHFEFPNVVNPRILQVCEDLANECVTDPLAFFESYLTNSSVSYLVAIVDQDQGYFVTPIVALLVVDFLATFMSEFYYQMSRRGAMSTRFLKGFHALEGLLMVVSVSLTIGLVALVGFMPIDFSFQSVLVHDGSFVNGTFQTGLFLIPRSDLIENGEDGLGDKRLVLDSTADISLCAEHLRQDIDSSWLGEISSELFQEFRVGTGAETCRFNSISFPSPSCFEIPCAGTSIPLSTSQQTEPQIDFVLSQVLLGVVAIDLALTITEIVIFFLFNNHNSHVAVDSKDLVTAGKKKHEEDKL